MSDIPSGPDQPIFPLLRRQPKYSSRDRTLVLIAALCLLGILAAEEWLSIRHLSITLDEGAHTYAGYQHWTARDFGVNPEHPPLVKLIATAPLLGLHLIQPHPPPINFMVEQYLGGSQLYAQNDADLVLRRVRMAASLFTFILAALVFAAGYEIFGPPVALLALTLFTFEPTVLAHGALITTDMGVACFLFASFYTFYRFLKRPGIVRLLLCGLAVGLAFAAKISGVLAIPILIALALTDVAFTHFHRAHRMKTLAASLIAIFVLGYAVLWSFYTFRYAARPGDLVLSPSVVQLANSLHSPWQAHLLVKLAATHLFPEGYLFGWAKLLSNVTGVPAFLFGHIYASGTWAYFPAALIIKSSLSLLLLLAISPWLLKRFGKDTYVPSIALGIAFCIILLSCMTSRLQIGVRHELALFPFAVVLAAAAGWALASASRIGAAVVAALFLFQCISSLHSYPDYLPYVNEAFGGPSKAYLALTDSNVDWGQQLKEVDAYVKSQGVSECWFAYSNISASAEAIPCKPLPTGLALMAGAPQPIVPPHIHGTILISAVDISGVLWGPGDLNPYRQFRDRTPDALIGNSILIYRGDFDVPLLAATSHMSQVPALVQMHKTDAALGEANTACSLDPESPMLEAAMGATLLHLGRIDEAHQALAHAMQKAREHKPDDQSQAVAAQITRQTQSAI
jgi:4-amino-4-deoxy-L-arabinose transferase-like glycosyltransferase